MFLSSADLRGIRTTPVLMPGKPAVQGPDLSTLAGVTAYRTKVAERHSQLAQDVATLKRTAAAAGGQVPEAAARDLARKEEQRKKLGITMARLDQKILEFTAAAAGEQLPASAAASPKAPPGAGKRISLKLPTAPAPAAPGTGKRLSLKLPTRPAEPVVEAAPMDVAPAPAGQGKRLSLKLPTRPADEAPPTAAPMDVEPPAAPAGQGKRLSLKLPARLADQPPPPPPPPPSSNAMSDD